MQKGSTVNKITSIKDSRVKNFIKKYYPECVPLEIVESSQIQDDFDVNTEITINNYVLAKTKTTKVLFNDSFTCTGCMEKSKYVIAMQCGHLEKVICAFLIEHNNRLIPLTKDHKIPKSQDGTSSFKNLQCMCYDCNQLKANSVCSNIPIESNMVRKRPSSDVVKVPVDEFNILKEKEKDFAHSRKRLKKVIKKCPWYYRIFGLNKYMENSLVKPLRSRGYYNCNSDSDNET